jgi:hypothetical protein
MKVFTILLLVLGISASVSAATSGVVYGYITVNDSRANPYDDVAVDNVQKRHDISQKFRQPTANPNVFTPSIVPLKNAAVDVSVCSGSGLGPCIGQTVYTSNSGYYAWYWSSPNVNRDVVDVKVRAQRRASDSTSAVPYSIAIKSALPNSPITLHSWTSNANAIPQNGNYQININLTASEASNAYLTAEEVVSIVRADTIAGGGAPDDATSMISYSHGAFQYLDLVVNDNTISPDGGAIAPTDETILLNPGVGSTSTPAHEMGHTMMWRLFGFPIAQINPLIDYLCDGVTSWKPWTQECERAAFMDGFADFIAALYKWKKTSTDSYQRGYWLAPPDTKCPPHDPNVTNSNHDYAQCNTRGFWRVYRQISLGKILNAIDYYPLCAIQANDNHCSNERCIGVLPVLDPDAINWYDFRYNWELANGTSITSATDWAGLRWSEQ